MTEGVRAARVTYREVLRVREFRAIFLAQMLSTVGDQVSRVAVSLLVFERSGSAFAASATFACSYFTWLLGGPLLATAADRYPRVEVMVVSDVLRALLVASIALDGVPLPVVFALLILIGVLAPPFDASRSSLLPEMLAGDRYLVGNALMNAGYQAGQVSGFLAGGGLVALVGYQSALLLDASSFLLSAGLLLMMVRSRPPSQAKDDRTGVLRETWAGISAVRMAPDLRRLLAYGLLAMAIVIPSEGLAVSLAAELGDGPSAVGAMTAAVPAGFLLGSALVVRLRAEVRLSLLPYLIALSAVPLLAAPLMDSSSALTGLFVLAGTGSAIQLIVNAEYVLRTPPELRGRAYGVAGTLLMATQGVVLLATGAAAEAWSPRTVIATTGLLGIAALPLVRRLGPVGAELATQGN